MFLRREKCTNHIKNQTLKHITFDSRIINLFVARNIQEAVDDPTRKDAVMEEMNSF